MEAAKQAALGAGRPHQIPDRRAVFSLVSLAGTGWPLHR